MATYKPNRRTDARALARLRASEGMGMREAINNNSRSNPAKFEVNSSFISVGLLALVAPIVVMSIQAFYKVDRAAQDINGLTIKIERIKSDVTGLETNSARTEAKLDIIAELLREVRNNQEKGK